MKPSDTPEAENKKVGQYRNRSGNGTAAPPANRAVAFSQDSVPRASGTTGSVRPPMSDDNGLEQDLSEAWATANRPLQMSKTDRMLQKAGKRVLHFSINDFSLTLFLRGPHQQFSRIEGRYSYPECH